MKGYIPPFILILIGIGYYYFQPSRVIGSSEEKRTEDKPLAKKNHENKESEDKPIAKKSFEIKESENKEIYGDPFPRRYSFE